MPTVLILAASPLDADRLRLNAEVKKIKQALERSRNRENWRIETNEAATVDDLRRHLLDHQPTVVHFCGHGLGEGGLCFEDEDGQTHQTHAAPLAKLFHLVKAKLKCIVLNACYSEVQARAISQNIDYVIGMKTDIRDDAAIKFAVAFYDAAFAGIDFRTAFDFGCTAIDLHNLPETRVPVLLTSPQLGGTALQYTENVPEIENVLQAYLNTPYADRHRWTTEGDRVAEAMRQFYGDRMLTPVSKVTVMSKRQIDKRHWKVHARIEAAGERAFHDYYVRIEGRDIKVAWEASVGYWSMPVNTYLALGTDKDIVARVTARIGNDYYGSFRGQQAWFQNVLLGTEYGQTLYGYVRRKTPACQELMSILADGNAHEITLAVANMNDETENPVVNAVLSRTWILPEAAGSPPTT